MTQQDKEDTIKETLRRAFPEPLRLTDVLRMDGARDVPLLSHACADFPDGYVTMAQRSPGDSWDSWLVINNEDDLVKWRAGDLLLYGFGEPKKWCVSYVDRTWSVRVSEVDKVNEKVSGEVLLGGSCMGRFTWKAYVPRLIGDIIGVVPERLEAACVSAARAAYESLP